MAEYVFEIDESRADAMGNMPCERRAVAARLREAASRYESMERDVDFYPVESALGLKPAGETAYTPESVRSLADLIEPSFDLDTVQRVCFECMEGCDEPEWTLYMTIYDAIARYKRGESGSTCDRDALLALADEMTVEKGDIWGWSRRIREALGVDE